MTPYSALEIELLRASFHDGAMRVSEGSIVMLRSNVVFTGNDYVRAFRSLRARSFLKWNGHSVSGGELYGLTEEGREAYRVLMAEPPPSR